MYNRGVLIGIAGLFAGICAAQCVDWKTVPKAMLVVIVAVVVSAIVWALTRKG